MAIINDVSQNFSCGNAVLTQFLMWKRRSHAFPPHYTTDVTYISVIFGPPLSRIPEHATVHFYIAILIDLFMLTPC